MTQKKYTTKSCSSCKKRFRPGQVVTEIREWPYHDLKAIQVELLCQSCKVMHGLGVNGEKNK